MKGQKNLKQLTNNIVTNRIQDLLANTEKQTLSRLKSSFAFLLQLVESTDVSEVPVILAFVSYLFQNKTYEHAYLLHGAESFLRS